MNERGKIMTKLLQTLLDYLPKGTPNSDEMEDKAKKPEWKPATRRTDFIADASLRSGHQAEHRLALIKHAQELAHRSGTDVAIMFKSGGRRGINLHATPRFSSFLGREDVQRSFHHHWEKQHRKSTAMEGALPLENLVLPPMDARPPTSARKRATRRPSNGTQEKKGDTTDSSVATKTKKRKRADEDHAPPPAKRKRKSEKDPSDGASA